MATAEPPSFGQLLRQHRIAAGLTQEALAERSGVAARTISDMERGLRRAPYPHSVSRLAEALRLSGAERARFEATTRRHGAPGVPAGTPITSPEAPPIGTLPPGLPPPTPTASRGAPGAIENWPSSRGTRPRALRARPLPSPRVVRSVSPAPPRSRGRLIGRLVGALLMALLVGGTLFSTGATAQHPQTGGGKLCLATDFPTSGQDPFAQPGKLAEHAVDLAVRQNQALGDGYTLQAINYDDVSSQTGINDPPTGAQNVWRMVQNPCIVGMVGPYESRVARAEMPIAANAGLAMISPSNTDPALTLRPYAQLEGFDFDRLHPAGKPLTYFRVAPTDVAQVSVDADFTVDDLEARSVFVVSDRYPYGEALASYFTERFQVKGGTIAGHETILPGNPSLIAQVAARIVATNPDVVFYGGVTRNGGGRLKGQLVTLGYRGPFVGGDGIARDPSFIDQAGADAASGTFATVAAPDPSSFTAGAAVGFVRDYRAQYPGQTPDGYSANAYDAAMILIAAIKYVIRAGEEVTRPAVRDRVQRSQYDGVTGPISFDRNGDNTHGVFSVYTVQDGQWVWMKQETA